MGSYLARILTVTGWVLIPATALFLASESRAAEVVAGSVYNEAQEAEIVQHARRRIYPGGRDEGDLAVQTQMTTPTRKISPKAEAARDPGDD